LSPCIHSILASKIDKDDKAYEMYLRTARLDLDDYNHEVHEGLHITSMAGTWLSVVQGFGGMRNFDNKLTFNPKIPKQWTSYAFKINYRDAIIQVFKSHDETRFTNLSDKAIQFFVKDKPYTLKSNESISF
jgi:maltose phosphorylase